MPVVTVTLIEGAYDEGTREGLARRLTGAVQATIGAPMEGITVIVNEVAPANYMRGGVRRTPGAPPPAPAELARAYLEAMEAEDIDKARGFLADGFAATVPGGGVIDSPEGFIERVRSRYRVVRKTFERLDEAPGEDGAVVVYCCGTLSGEWPDGTPFEGIRFIDRFTVAGGKLVDQMIWNDVAERRAGEP